MSVQGVNWHNVGATVFAQPWAYMLVLTDSRAGNIGWFGAGTNNTGTVYVGFGPDTTIPVNGVRSNTDGWPVGAGQVLPLLTGEGQDVGSALYAITNTVAQDFYVIGYAPNQRVS
jgi:hypothetical protein